MFSEFLDFRIFSETWSLEAHYSYRSVDHVFIQSTYDSGVWYAGSNFFLRKLWLPVILGPVYSSHTETRVS